MKKKTIIIISLFLVIAVAAIIIATSNNMIDAYYIHNGSLVKNIISGKMRATISEDEQTKQIFKPNEEIIKNPTLENNGELNGYIRAQIYIPIATINYIDLQNNNEVSVTGEKELFEFKQYVKLGWEEVLDEGFSGTITDTSGNKYKVYTYKFMDNGQEKLIERGEKITTPVFDKVKLINYVDGNNGANFNIIIKAIAVQSQNGSTPEQMWTYYKNQNGTGIVGAD